MWGDHASVQANENNSVDCNLQCCCRVMFAMNLCYWEKVCVVAFCEDVEKIVIFMCKHSPGSHFISMIIASVDLLSLSEIPFSLSNEAIFVDHQPNWFYDASSSLYRLETRWCGESNSNGARSTKVHKSRCEGFFSDGNSRTADELRFSRFSLSTNDNEYLVENETTVKTS